MPRAKHEPTKHTKELVSLHATMGTTQELIGAIVGVDEKTLRKHYRDELDQAMAKANATIGGTLFNKAKGGDTTAMIFWMKTRAGWRDRANPGGEGAVDDMATALKELAQRLPA